MRTTITLDDDLAVRLERYQHQLGTSFRRAVNDAVRAGLGELETGARHGHEAHRTESLPLGSRIGGSIDNVQEALAVAETESFR